MQGLNALGILGRGLLSCKLDPRCREVAAVVAGPFERFRLLDVEEERERTGRGLAER